MSATPAVATVEIAPQAQAPAEVGTLQILFGALRLQFPDCAVDHALVRRSPAGMVVALTLLGAAGAMAAIPDGALVEVDPSLGSVRVLERP